MKDLNGFVSRGGIKLQTAIVNFQLSIVNLVVLDVGSSTGGFVDCLLQNGASKVYAVDTAYGELAWKLRNDPRVVVIERTNILRLESLPEQAEGPEQGRRVDLITIDAGWTKLELVLPVVKKFLKPGGIIIALLKPNYETDKWNLVKGVVRGELVEQVRDEVIRKIEDLGFKVVEVTESPILGSGGKGNREFLLKITC